ncbi:hypothetical protein D3C83_165930 [compost metagenome]
MCKDVIAASKGINEGLRDALLAVAGEKGEVNTMRFGKWVSRYDGRIQAGMKFTRASARAGVVLWKIEHVE